MAKMKEKITILAIGDGPDHDSYKKLHKEKPFILKSGFDYKNTSYKRFLTNGFPAINTKKVIVFLFFPFLYWNEHIEHKNYKGVYGSHIFFNKFSQFWNKVDKASKRFLKEKEVFFVNRPNLCALYRDKIEIARKFSRAGVKYPEEYKMSRVKDIVSKLGKGRSFFLKPRYGSMGKGITFLSWSNWQTNLMFKDNKIKSRHSDHGWKFRDITGDKAFLSKILRSDMLIGKAIDSLLLKKMKIDMRVYTFLGKTIYIYPRKNNAEKITTNISQGAKGDPNILKELPRDLVKKTARLAERASRALGLNFAGVDIMIDKNIKDIYVLDANVFPGFPKRRTFKLARRMVGELLKSAKKGKLRFEKT